MFDPSKPVQTRDGRPARIICIDMERSIDGHKIVALIKGSTGENPYVYTSEGRIFSNNPSPVDLVNVPEKVSGFWNIWPLTIRPSSSYRHASLEDAVRGRGGAKGAVGVIEIVFEDGVPASSIIHKE